MRHKKDVYNRLGGVVAVKTREVKEVVHDPGVDELKERVGEYSARMVMVGNERLKAYRRSGAKNFREYIRGVKDEMRRKGSLSSGDRLSDDAEAAGVFGMPSVRPSASEGEEKGR